jgi:thiamine pyrophosphate-dependent acetolactate synthase large subunit-like protein
MPETVADALWSMLADAGVRRCYGIVGDALNPVIDALRRNGRVEFIHVRNEEAGAFAAVAEACLTDNPVAVCGTAGPGVVHLLNGLVDAQREGAPVIAIAGDVTSGVIDTGALEEVNPYATFQVASLYTGRIVNPAQTRAVVQTAIRTALAERGPTVIALPGDVAASKAPAETYQAVLQTRRCCDPTTAICRRWRSGSMPPARSRFSAGTAVATPTTSWWSWRKGCRHRSVTRSAASSGWNGATPMRSG